MKDGYITQETLDAIVGKYEDRIEELQNKVWNAHMRERSLKYDIEQRDKTIVKAHHLLTTSTFR